MNFKINLLSFFLLSTLSAFGVDLKIGTGTRKGLYYETGGNFSRLSLLSSQKTNVKIEVLESKGSIDNLRNVLNGKVDIGIVQSDNEYQVMNGLNGLNDIKNHEDLRFVFSLYTESLTIIVNNQSKINSVSDLKDHSVYLGNIGSGSLSMSKLLLKGLNIDEKEDIIASYTLPRRASGLLVLNKIDAFIFTLGHPNKIILRSLEDSKNLKVIPINGNTQEKLLNDFPFFTKSTIPLRHYKGFQNKEAQVESIGVKALLLASKNVDNEKIYEFTKHIFENFEGFKKMHPSYEVLDKKNMVQRYSSKMHPGALKYFKEQNLL